ncbi:MAG: hypothetical protein NUV31_06455 [Dehalococcoidales bacterium]|jgi:hypothetical protein|nr:hypothetical protein [Dehalococcoidales bacterium]
MDWCRRHLNLTLFFAWLVANFMVYLPYFLLPADGRLPLTGLLLVVMAAIIMLGTEIWYLRQKRRSLFFLFLNLLNLIGFAILLSLENRAAEQAIEEKGFTSETREIT